MVHLLKTNINGNPNVGLFGFVTDKFCLLGKEVPEHQAKKFEEIMQVPVRQLNIIGTPLLGVFLAGTQNDILVPSIIFDTELSKLKEIAEEFKFNIHIIKTDLTALGNNILVNEKGCLVNNEFKEKEKKQIKEALNFNIKEGLIASLPTVGSVAVINKSGIAIHRDAQDFELDFLQDIFGIQAEHSTVNMGNPFLRSGILVNSYGFIVGDMSGGPEINHLDQIFGFLKV